MYESLYIFKRKTDLAKIQDLLLETSFVAKKNEGNTWKNAKRIEKEIKNIANVTEKDAVSCKILCKMRSLKLLIFC